MLRKPDFNKPVFSVFPEKAERIRNGLCADCGRKIHESDFRDELSKKEYSISGFCQECQDSVFGAGRTTR